MVFYSYDNTLKNIYLKCSITKPIDILSLYIYTEPIYILSLYITRPTYISIYIDIYISIYAGSNNIKLSKLIVYI